MSDAVDDTAEHSDEDLAAELRKLVRLAERAAGAPIKVVALAKKLHLSASSLYAYLDGTTLPSRVVLDKLLHELGVAGAELGRIADLRDQVEDRRRVRRRRSPARPGRATAPVVSPCQLPPDVRGFTGRAKQLAELDELLAARESSTAATAAVVSGTAGVGKTALGVHWAHRVREEFTEGLLYVDLRGFAPEQPLEPSEVLDGFLRSLGVAGDSVPGRLAERAAQFRAQLDRRRILVFLDNASSEEQVRHLLPSSPSCFVIVTSRNTLPGLVARHGAHLITVNSLPVDDAVSLLRTLLGEQRVKADQTGAAALVERCARLPLAIRIGADLATTRRRSPLTELATELHQYHLDLFNAGGDERTAIRTVFSWSFLHLRADRARAFRLLGLHPGQDIDAYASAALVGVDLPEAQLRIDDLIRANLLEEAGHRRYRMHDLLRAYAREQTANPNESNAAMHRLFGHYLGGAVNATNLIAQHGKTNRPAVPVTVLPPLATAEGAMAWLDAERRNLLTLAEFAVNHGQPEHAITISALLSSYLDRRGHYSDAMELHSLALRVANAGTDALKALVLHRIGIVHMRLGHNVEAVAHQERVLAVAREVGDRVLESAALLYLGLVRGLLGDHERACDHLGYALLLTREVGNRHIEGQVLRAMGLVHTRLGYYQDALACHQDARAVAATMGNHNLDGHVLNSLGLLHQRMGHHNQARDCHQQALIISRSTGDRGLEADSLASFGCAYLAQKREEALDVLDQALTLAMGIGRRDIEGTVRRALGQVHADLGDSEQALGQLRQALAIARDTGNHELEADVLNSYGAAMVAIDPQQALETHEQALDIALETGSLWQQAQSHHGLGNVCRKLGRQLQAQDHYQETSTICDKLGLHSHPWKTS